MTARKPTAAQQQLDRIEAKLAALESVQRMIAECMSDLVETALDRRPASADTPPVRHLRIVE